MKKIVKLLLLF